MPWPTTRRLIGTKVPRVDAPEKATGRAKYSYDINRPGMLHAKMLRCPHAHAKVKTIDTSQAEKAPGVRKRVQQRPLGRSGQDRATRRQDDDRQIMPTRPERSAAVPGLPDQELATTARAVAKKAAADGSRRPKRGAHSILGLAERHWPYAMAPERSDRGETMWRPRPVGVDSAARLRRPRDAARIPRDLIMGDHASGSRSEVLAPRRREARQARQPVRGTVDEDATRQAGADHSDRSTARQLIANEAVGGFDERRRIHDVVGGDAVVRDVGIGILDVVESRNRARRDQAPRPLSGVFPREP